MNIIHNIRYGKLMFLFFFIWDIKWEGPLMIKNYHTLKSGIEEKNHSRSLFGDNLIAGEFIRQTIHVVCLFVLPDLCAISSS